MADRLNDPFIEHLNQNIGIAHKVISLYFEDGNEREDVLQEMMYQLWRFYPAFDGRSKFSTWMYRVCLNTALTYRRKSKKRKTDSLSADHQEIADEISENQEENIALLLDSMATLSGLNKAIVLLYMENMSYEEIASVLGLSRSNVSVRLVRIKKELETQF